MVTKAITAAAVGINAYKIEVEVDVINSLPNISIVGLPDNAVNEARERVHSAIKNSGFTFPLGRVIVNLAPADIRKEGTNFDLPIAIGILKEQGINIADDLGTAFLGELSLDGSLRGLAQRGRVVVSDKENSGGIELAEAHEVFGVKVHVALVAVDASPEDKHGIDFPLSLQVCHVVIPFHVRGLPVKNHCPGGVFELVIDHEPLAALFHNDIDGGQQAKYHDYNRTQNLAAPLARILVLHQNLSHEYILYFDF